MRQDQLAQVAPVRFGPRALARVTVAVAQQEGFELRPPAEAAAHGTSGGREMGEPPQILHRVGPRPAEVAHRFIAGLGHLHRGQFAGAVQSRQLEGVAPVRLDPLARARGDQRRRHHRAVDFELPEPPGQDKAGRPGLVADPQFRTRMGLPEFGKDLLQGMQIVGDGAVEAGGAAVARGEANGDVLRVDIESDEE